MNNPPNHHVHGPDCDHEHEHDSEVIIVTDENGEECEMIMLYTFESKERAYAVLIDRNKPDEDGMIVRIEEEDEESYLVFIEDEEEWQHVVSIYNEFIEQETK